MKNENYWTARRIAKLIAFGVLLYAAAMNPYTLGKLLHWLFALVSPILMGLIFALILNVPMHGFQRLLGRLDRRGHLSDGVRQGLSLALAVLAVPVVLFVLIRFIVPQFVNAVTNAIAIVQQNEQKIAAFLAQTGLSAERITAWLHELGTWINANLGRIAGFTVSTALDVFSSVANVVLALILAIYLLADKAALRRRGSRVVRALLPERWSSKMLRFTSMFVSTFRTFLSCQCLEALILGGLVLACTLILRIPYAMTIACVTAVLALIPYIGAMLSLVLGVVLVVTVSPVKALIFAAVSLIAQQVEGNLIYPKVVGQSVGLPAYVTLAAIMLGGALAGIVGMFFVIPVVSVIYTLLREFVCERLDGSSVVSENTTPRA